MHSILRFIYTGTLLLCLLVSNNELLGQTANDIIVSKNESNSRAMMCTGTQFAGDFQLGAINAQSNDITINRMFLCAGDQFNIDHNLNAIFSGDPDPNTSPGIGYAWYKCAPNPALSGPDPLSVITSDPCVFDLVNNPALGIFIYTDQQNGDALFRNVPFLQANGNIETIPEYYNSGNPLEIWFAPITYDRLDATSGQAAYEMGGPCVDVNTNATFSVVYLNPLEVTNVITNVGGDPLTTSFVPTGGVSEFDGSNYTSLTIRNVGDPNITATNIMGIQEHGSTITFRAPQAGEYTITIEDSKGCSFSQNVLVGQEPVELLMGGCDTLQNINVEPGDLFCLPFVVNNFDSIISISLAVVWDASVLQFQGLQNFGHPLIDNSAFGTTFPNALTFIPFNLPIIDGLTLPDGTVLFEICFEVVGIPNASTFITVSDFQQVNIEVATVSSGSSEFPFALQNPPCEIMISPTNNLVAYLESCGGLPTGDAEITVFGGVDPINFTYEEIGNAGNNGAGVISGIMGSFTAIPGNYTVTVTDNLGGSYTDTIEIASSFLMIEDNMNLTVFTSPTCYDFTNGQITVQAINGTPPYAYELLDLINPGPNRSGFIFTDGGSALIPSLPASNYFLSVVDGNGCEAQLNITLEANPFILDIVNINDASCIGSGDGGIAINVSGPTPFPDGEYRFDFPSRSFFNIPTNGGQFAIGNLDPGVYDITFKSNTNNCDTTISFTIGSSEIISAMIIPMDESCSGANNGSVDITGTVNGTVTGAFNFTILDSMNAVVATPPTTSNLVYNGLMPGLYKVVVENDANSCLSDTLLFTINTAGAIEVTLDSTTLANCLPSSNTGSAAFFVNGGVAPYVLDAGPGNGIVNGNSINNISSGNYIATVTDANLCTGTLAFTIQQYDDITDQLIDYVIDGNPCAGGTISVFYNGELADDSEVGITWTLDGPNPIGTTPTISIDDPGSYSVTIFDGSIMCILDGRDTLIECDDIFGIDISVIQPECDTSALPGSISSGSVVVDTNNAVGNVTYFWSFPDTTTTGIYADIAPGFYYVTVTDQDSTVVDSFEIIAPSPIEMIFAGIDSTSCFDNCDGEVDITPVNLDNPIDEFYLFWTDNNGAMLSDTGFVMSIDGLCGGFNSFIVSQEGSSCFYQDSVDIPTPDSVQVELLNSNDISCFGLTDGTLSVTGTGGSGNYAYLWENMNMTNAIANLAADTFTITVTDSKGCFAVDSFIISEPDSLIVSVDSLNSTVGGCAGQLGTITTIVSGGNSNFNFDWTPNITSDSIAIDLDQGLYQILVTDNNGCTDTASFEITAPLPLGFTIDTISLPPCSGDDAIITIDTAFGGSGSGYTFSVQNGMNEDIGAFIPLPAGEYMITVSDSTGCSIDTMLTIFDPNPIIIDIDPDSIIIDLGSTGELTVFILDSDNPINSIIWTPGELLDCDTCTTVTVLPIPSDQIFTVTVSDTSGCIAMAEALVMINTERRVFIPNTFTPNSDGRNEIFQVFTAGEAVLSINSFQVFDRWGEQVFVGEPNIIQPSETGSGGWNGRFRGDSVEMEPGVYAYVIEITFIDRPNDPFTYRGNVTLLR